MSLTEEIEEKLGLKIDELKPIEKETYFSMLEAVNKSQLTLEKWRDYIVSMRMAIQMELVNEPEMIRVLGIFPVINRKQILLKARMQNYILMENILISPERARQQLEQMVAGMLPKA